MGDTGRLPLPGLCPYLKHSEKPTLFATVHTKDCPMRSAVVVHGQKQEFTEEELDNMAQELYDTFRTNLANQTFAKIPVPARRAGTAAAGTVAATTENEGDEVWESESSEEEYDISLGGRIINHHSSPKQHMNTTRRKPGPTKHIRRKPVTASAHLNGTRRYAVGVDTVPGKQIPVRRKPFSTEPIQQPSSPETVIYRPVPTSTATVGARHRQGNTSGFPDKERTSILAAWLASTRTEEQTNIATPGPSSRIPESNPHHPNDYNFPPRRMWLFRVLEPSVALIEGNPMVTIYGNAAPRSAFVFSPRVTISSHPQGEALGMLKSLIGKQSTSNIPFTIVNAFTTIRNFSSARV
ncbi:hypothetical protein EDB81DRAFT_880532 [Dactylonectria macrodidyma]|uniref:Uncharacterized protein n=1 Tax=Dactylonectria macrodidyma TaxID=307937 RepID=A0A9P9F9E5_9HYPO|nr:hypothetical protein EDB81DRAFT_880532 [Dactylonectria macrodidyma]